FCLSRSKNERLIEKAKDHQCQLEYFEYDLNDISGIDEIMETIFHHMTFSKADRICLINNAGMLDPVKPVGKGQSERIIVNINVNAIAPMLLTSQFITHTENLSCQKTVINISSGAGSKPFFGWSCYCSAKAAMDMFTRCAGLEQQNHENPVRVISFSPGIIDTDMQAQIRNSSQEDFIQVENFKKYKQDGALREASLVAMKVIETVNSPDIENGSMVNIRDLFQ
ncbi:MAG: (S)-benzoin forming benzil reductase, partial [Clostridia bacterium]|nr:(S)-benzoin forming benzil reductase [Clostridia bacterium]